MRALSAAMAMTMVCATGAYAQERGTEDASGHVTGIGGFARLTPTPQFAFASGVMPDGSTPTPGSDVTSAIVAAGDFAAPPASTALMYTLGGGAQVEVVPHWVVDVGYRYSRIGADSTLSASPLNVNGMTFGFGYRF